MLAPIKYMDGILLDRHHAGIARAELLLQQIHQDDVVSLAANPTGFTPSADLVKTEALIGMDGALVEVKHAQHDIVQVKQVEAKIQQQAHGFLPVALAAAVALADKDPDHRTAVDRVDGE